MGHHKIQPLADLATTGMALQDQLRTLQQKRGLGRVLLGRKLLEPAIKVFRNTEIHSHSPMVPNQYHTGTVVTAPARRTGARRSS